jgi:hypothetical protein
LGVSFGAARRLVGSLEEQHVLEEISGRRRSRVYSSREIVKVLQEPLENEEPRSARELLGKHAAHANLIEKRLRQPPYKLTRSRDIIACPW